MRTAAVDYAMLPVIPQGEHECRALLSKGNRHTGELIFVDQPTAII
jgi:hypothetical protein